MKLTETALTEIKKIGTRRKLAVLFNCSDFTILRYIKHNDDNLTKAAALKVIVEETGLKQSEILIESEVAQANAK